MKFLVVLSAAVVAGQCAAVLPYHGLGYGYGGYGYGLGGLGYGYPYGLVHAAPEVEIKEAEPVELPALHLGGYGYGLGGLYGGLGYYGGYGLPYALPVAATEEAAAAEE